MDLRRSVLTVKKSYQKVRKFNVATVGTRFHFIKTLIKRYKRYSFVERLYIRLPS